MDPRNLPFEVGQLVETRSFVAGYRGAWFRCKIKEIGWKNKELGHALEYIDFPDEKIRWTKLYQKHGKSRDEKRALMVRPCFPCVYRESQMPDVNTISEVVVTINDFWKVGDLVDWWTDDCFWSGRIIEKLGDEKFKIKLPPPPVGEGSSYEVLGKDLRPSLDWSVDDGWKVLIPKENKYLCCARIVKSLNQGGSPNLIDQTVGKSEKDVRPAARASHSQKSGKKSLNVKQTNTTEKIIGLNIVDRVPTETSCSDGVSSSHIQDTSRQTPRMVIQRDKCDDSGLKKMKIDESICLNSTYSDTIEAAILDMEELICRVKWLKRILDFGTPLSDNSKSSWNFVEHRASSISK